TNKLAPAVQKAFGEAVQRQVEDDALPPTVGWLQVGKQKCLFFVRDAHLGRVPPAPAAPPAPAHVPPPADGAPPADFPRAFDEAFQRLDRAAGSHNFVSLVDLRRALPVARATFDAGLFRLRLDGRYSLSAAEGRHGISP